LKGFLHLKLLKLLVSHPSLHLHRQRQNSNQQFQLLLA
jgi:hypothetical protein